MTASARIPTIAAIGLLLQAALSWPLWYPADRLFPVLPLWGEAFAAGRGWTSWAQASVLVALAAWAAIRPRALTAMALAAGLVLLVILDLNRLQPWVYFYFLIFLAVWDGEHKGEAVDTLRLLLASVYLWSGLNKLTPYFAEENVPWLLEAWSAGPVKEVAPLIGYGLALLEAVMGPGLLWPRVRPFFRWLVVGFHALVILSLWKLQWNLVVIPWNLVMAVLVWLVFAGPEPPVWPRRIRAGGLVILTALLPVLNIFHAWPEALSWKMYSNTQPEMTVYTRGGPPCSGLSGVWARLTFDEGTKMTLDDWAIDRMGVPPVAGDWIFLPLGRYICRCAAPADSAGIYILTVERWDRGAERLEKIPCELLPGRSR